MKNCVYIVTMYRWGNHECHSYVLGAYSTKTKAEKAASLEQAYRGGTKYYPEVLEVPIDAQHDCVFKVIVELKQNPHMDFSVKNGW